MTEKQLYSYRMNLHEEEKWYELKESVLKDYKKMQISQQYFSWINKMLDPIDPYNHVTGYSQTDGYFYIVDGDRGAINLGCCSHDTEDMRWYLLTRIVRYVGQKYELEHRKSEEKRWRYIKTYKDGGVILKKRLLWKYNTCHDTRKMWFEYGIHALAKVVDSERLKPFVDERTGLLNLWFEQPHWGFDWKGMKFIEISDSQERD